MSLSLSFGLLARLKAQATVATGNNPATLQCNGLQSNDSSIGLSYQFEY